MTGFATVSNKSHASNTGGHDRAFFWTLAVGERGPPSAVYKGHLLAGLALRVGDCIHVLANQVAQAPVGVAKLLTVGVCERSS